MCVWLSVPNERGFDWGNQPKEARISLKFAMLELRSFCSQPYLFSLINLHTSTLKCWLSLSQIRNTLYTHFIVKHAVTFTALYLCGIFIKGIMDSLMVLLLLIKLTDVLVHVTTDCAGMITISTYFPAVGLTYINYLLC